MMRFLTLTRRTFLVIAAFIGLALVIVHATRIIRSTPLESLAGGLVLSLAITHCVSLQREAAYRGLMNAIRENERTGKFLPHFPETSTSPQINLLSKALNAAARSVVDSETSLDRAYLQFVETMAQALDARDRYTAGHSLRVAEYSYTLALAMGLPQEAANTIRVAAQLHDIGKIGIPDAVLQKPGVLSAEEYGLIKLHPQIGRQILEKVRRFDNLLSVVELHHENHDGTGYPFGLAGDEIPLYARIVHVADSFDAMTSTRIYRRALSMRAAVLEIERNAGRMFDPAAAHTFVHLIAEGRIEISKLDVSTDPAVEVETLVRLTA
jgi:HD-GYP domain-containing protein (c-di-GMP phosphodiesterase class II)